MASQKFDFYEFVEKANAEFGTVDSDWDPYARVAILSFNEDPNRVCAKFNGRNVYPHNAFKDKIMNGDVWVCALSSNPNGGSNYFARGIKHLDNSFLLKLNQADIDAVVDFVWEKNRVSIEPILEEKYKAVLQEQVAKALEEKRKEDQEKIAELTEKLNELQKISAEDKASLKALEDSLEAMRSSQTAFTTGPGQPLPVVQAFTPWGQSEVVAPVHRISDSAIMSESFTRSRYSVHLSADHRFLLVTPDANGNVLCIANTLTLAGLNDISPFKEDVEMPCTYSREFNGMLISLS